jgi:hypothetical protein
MAGRSNKKKNDEEQKDSVAPESPTNPPLTGTTSGGQSNTEIRNMVLSLTNTVTQLVLDRNKASSATSGGSTIPPMGPLAVPGPVAQSYGSISSVSTNATESANEASGVTTTDTGNSSTNSITTGVLPPLVLDPVKATGGQSTPTAVIPTGSIKSEPIPTTTANESISYTGSVNVGGGFT